MRGAGPAREALSGVLHAFELELDPVPHSQAVNEMLRALERAVARAANPRKVEGLRPEWIAQWYLA